jgi:sucrose phosphorylase
MTAEVLLLLLQGLLAGSNDFEQLQNGGDCRDINRHYYSLQEAKQAVRRPVVQVRVLW